MTDQVLIQGITPDSINEVYVAMALDRLAFAYEFQKWFGLPGIRGSQVIDFLVYTVPLPTPLFVHGRYWHTGTMAAEDELKMAELESLTRKYWAAPVIIWEEDCGTYEDALNAVRKELMV